MSQVNKYANKAGYTADKNRKDTQSAVSYIEDDGALIYDGVNVVVDKPAAGVGDLAVFRRSLHAGRRHAAGQHLLYHGAGDHRCRLLVQAQAHAVVGCFVQRNFGYRALGLHARSARDAPRKAAHGNALGQSADPGVAGEKTGRVGRQQPRRHGRGCADESPRPRRAVLCRYEEQRGLPLRG